MKSKLFILCSILALGSLSSCSQNTHEHTFDLVNWEKNEVSHWHKATCAHTDLVKELSDHEFGDDNICNICGYERIIDSRHLVFFVSNGGSKVSPLQIEDGETASVPNEPTKQDYNFMGWYEDPDFSGNPFNFSTKITTDVTLYALWGAKVTFMNYDGNVFDQKEIRLNNVVSEPENPSWSDALFLGWYDNNNFEGSTFDFATTINKNITLYARYGVTVELIMPNGSVASSLIHPADKLFNRPSDMTIDYHDFDNWYSNEERTIPFDFSKKLTGNTKIYLNVIPKTYNITYENADGLTHANPSSYVYGTGVSTLLSPTANQQADLNKFYGWYRDAEFKVPATSISNDEHGDITLYAKRGTYHSITYVGWPKGIDNPNPTKFTKYDEVIFDGSSINATPYLSFASFEYNSSIVESVSNIDEDIVVNVDFVSPYTKVTFDPNGGKILPTTPYVNISARPKLNKINITNNDGTFNLYDPEVFKEAIGILDDYYYVDEFSMDSFEKTTVGDKDVYLIENGSTINATMEDKHGYNDGDLRLVPFEETGGWTKEEKSKIICYMITVSKTVKSVRITMNVESEGTNTLSVTGGAGEDQDFDYRASGQRNFVYDEVIDICGRTSFVFFYSGTNLKSDSSYSLSVTPYEYNDCYVKILPSSNPIDSDIDYYKNPVIPYSTITRDDHEFMGWFDDSGNEIDLTEPWNIAGSNFRLTAKWKYLDADSYINKLEIYKENQLELASNCDALNYDNCIRYSSISSHLFEEAKTNILENNYSKDELDNIYETFCATIEEMFLDHAKYDLTHELLAKVNAYKDELEGYEVEKGWLDELYNGLVELIRDSPTFLIAIYNYDAAVLSINQKYQFIIEHIDI